MSAMLSEDEQERYLDRGLKKIRAQAFHIHTSIEKNNLRQCLKETYSMLAELRTNALTPKNYYHLFTTVFDEMQIVEDFMQEEIKRGRKPRDLYDAVQQAQYLIPRLYLMVTAGSILMEHEPKCTNEIIFDLLGMVKGVQNPIRGLFVRYYLLKMIKNKLPDKDNVYEKEGGKFEDTLKFIIQNMDEMNRLWVRLSSGIVGNEKLLRDKERNELKTLVGESITRLSSLEGLTVEIYEKDVLPKLINIIQESNDPLSQQYLMECIIQAFSDSYNIKCIQVILDNTVRFSQEVDTKGLFISLMEKLAKFVAENIGTENEENKALLESAQSVYPILVQYFDRMQNESLYQGMNMDVNKLLDLNAAFAKFSMKCTKENEILGNINHVLTCTLNCLRQLNRRLPGESVKKLEKLLVVPLESNCSIFDMTDFDGLMLFLDYRSRKNLALKMIYSLVSENSKEKLDSTEKIQKLLKFIKPLIEDSPDATEEDAYTFESEQNTVCKIIFVLDSHNPEVLYEILGELKNVFSEGGVNRRKYTLPALANAIIHFCHVIALSYDNKSGLVPEEKKTEIVNQLINLVDISKIDGDETFYQLMLNIYKLLNDTISTISQENPEIAYKTYLTAAAQVNSIKSNHNNFEEACMSFMNSALTIFQEGKYDQNLKYNLLCEMTGYMLTFNILGDENIENIIKVLMEAGKNMVKRSDQFNSMLSIGELYHVLLKNGEKVLDCVSKARKFADFAMTNPQNLNLFNELLNKFLYYVELDDGVVTVKGEQIDEVIEVIKNHIQTVKNEVSMDSSFLPPVEKYFNNTLEIIKKRKEEPNHKTAYDSVLN